jgi:hypothetical protein
MALPVQKECGKCGEIKPIASYFNRIYRQTRDRSEFVRNPNLWCRECQPKRHGSAESLSDDEDSESMDEDSSESFESMDESDSSESESIEEEEEQGIDYEVVEILNCQFRGDVPYYRVRWADTVFRRFLDAIPMMALIRDHHYRDDGSVRVEWHPSWVSMDDLDADELLDAFHLVVPLESFRF